MSAQSPSVPHQPDAPEPTAGQPPIAAQRSPQPDRGPSLAALADPVEGPKEWKHLFSACPQSVRLACQTAGHPMLEERLLPQIVSAWNLRSAPLEKLPAPSLKGLDWLFPSLPLAEWQRAYVESLRLSEWCSSPEDPRQDWRFKAMTHRGQDDLVLDQVQPQHPPLIVEPGPQTWLLWTVQSEGRKDQPEPCLLLAATEETVMQGEIRRSFHLHSGLTVALMVEGNSLLLEDQEDAGLLQLCRLLQHQRRVFSEAPIGQET